MKHRLLLTAIVLFFIFDIGLLYYYVSQKNNPAAPQVAPQELNEFLPNISITKFTYDKTVVNQGKVTAQFTLENLENVSLSHLTLNVELEQGLSNGTLALIHRYLHPKNIALKPRESRRINFSYELPDSLNADGVYFLSPNILSQTGITIAHASETLKGIIGDNKMLEIDWRDSKIIHQGQEKNPLEGPIFEPKDRPQISLLIKNTHIFPISAIPHFVIYPRAQIADTKPIADYQEAKIDFAPESEAKLTLTLPAYEKAESYLANLTFVNTVGQPVSGIAEFRWVIGGPGGKILSLKLNKAEDYFGKITSSITASVIGPPDALTVKNSILQIKFFSNDEKKNLLGAFSQTLDINAQPKNIVFPLSFSSRLLRTPMIVTIATLTTQDQNLILDTTKEEIPFIIDRSRQRLTIYIAGIFLILIVFIAIFMYIFRRKKFSSSTLQSFLLFFLASHVLLFFSAVVPSYIFATTLNGGPDPGTGVCSKSSDPKCANETTPTFAFTVSLTDEARLNESLSITASGGVEIVMCSNGVSSYTTPTINSNSIDWGSYFMGAKNFIRQGTPRQLGPQPVEIIQYALASTPLCFSCQGATFTRTLTVVVKQPYYYCNEGNDYQCEALGTFYQSEAECESSNAGKDCYGDPGLCQIQCNKQEPTLPPLAQPTPIGLSPAPYRYYRCDSHSFTCIEDQTTDGTIVPNTCTKDSDCGFSSPDEPPPDIHPEPDPLPSYNVCKVYTDPLGTRFACDVSSAPGLSCIPGGDTCSSGWSGWTTTGPSCGLSSQERSCSCVGPCCSLAPTALTCAADLDGPSAHCGDTPQTRAACISQRPNNTPNITSITQPTAVLGSTKHDGGSVIQSLDVAVFWKFQEGDNGCGNPWGFAQTGNPCSNSGQVNKFTVKVYDPSGNLIETKDKASTDGNGNKNYSVNTTNQKIKTAGNYTVDVCANNGFGERCYSEAHSGQRFPFTKVKIPIGAITGDLIEHFNYVLPNGSYCAAPGVSSDVQLQLIRQYSNTPGLPSSLDCQTSTPVQINNISKITNYTCAVDYDNITVDIPTIENYQGSIDYLNQTFSLQLKQPVAGYNEYYCPRNNNNPFCNNNNLNANDKCTNDNSIEFVATGIPPKNEFDQNENPHYTATDPQTINVIFDILNTGANASNYYKLKNVQYRRLSGSGIYSPFPVNADLYDADDTGGFYFLTGQPGAALIQSPFDSGVATLGSGTTNGPRDTGSTLDISPKRWENNNYIGPTSVQFTPATFIELVKSRKKYTASSTPPANYNDPNTNIYMINTSSETTISDNQFNQNKIIIVNGANLKLIPNGSGKFNSSGKSVIFISTHTLKFDPAVDEANGVFMGQNVDLGTTNNTPLKIKGNLISVQPINTNPLIRGRIENQKPSLFVIFDPKTYMDLLPYLSTTHYTWNELVP